MTLKPYDKNEVRENAETIRGLASIWNNKKVDELYPPKGEKDFYKLYLEYCKNANISLGDEFAVQLFRTIAYYGQGIHNLDSLYKFHAEDSQNQMRAALNNVNPGSEFNYEMTTLLDVEGSVQRIKFHDFPVGKNLVTGEKVSWTLENKYDEASFRDDDIFLPSGENNHDVMLIRVSREDYEQYRSFKSGLKEFNSNAVTTPTKRDEYLNRYHELVTTDGKYKPIRTSETWYQDGKQYEDNPQEIWSKP